MVTTLHFQLLIRVEVSYACYTISTTTGEQDGRADRKLCGAKPDGAFPPLLARLLHATGSACTPNGSPAVPI